MILKGVMGGGGVVCPTGIEIYFGLVLGVPKIKYLSFWLGTGSETQNELYIY